MDYGTFKDYVRRAGLDLKRFARLVGMNQRSISNYSALGEVPRHVALLAVMMVELDRRNVEINDLIVKLGDQGKQDKKSDLDGGKKLRAKKSE